MSVASRQSIYDLRRRPIVVFAILIVAAGAIAAAVYGIAGFKRNLAATTCTGTLEVAKRVSPLARGEVAAFVVAEQPLLVPDLAFRDQAGNERHLSEWRGRTVLFNLWATWCIPCRKEMPALDALEQKLGSPSFEIVAVNIDTRDPDKPRAWLKTAGIERLAYYADPSAKVFQDLKTVSRALGMPTTLIIDPAGCEIGTMAGPAEWASPEALALVGAIVSVPGG
jgi:thiol-disulfide isomerase/thioredoxin